MDQIHGRDLHEGVGEISALRSDFPLDRREERPAPASDLAREVGPTLSAGLMDEVEKPTTRARAICGVENFFRPELMNRLNWIVALHPPREAARAVPTTVAEGRPPSVDVSGGEARTAHAVRGRRPR